MIVARQCYIEHGADLDAVVLRSLLPAYLPAAEVEADEALDGWLEVVYATYKRLFRPASRLPPVPTESVSISSDIPKLGENITPI